MSDLCFCTCGASPGPAYVPVQGQGWRHKSFCAHADERMQAAEIIAKLMTENVHLRDDNRRLRAGLTRNQEAWNVVRDILGLGPKDSVLERLQQLMDKQ